MSGYRPPYTHDEELKIVQYIVKKKAFTRLKGVDFWKRLEHSGTISRTWQSAKEHFRKKILKELHYPRYQLPAETVQKILDGYSGKVSATAAEAESEEEENSDSDEDVREVPVARQTQTAANRQANRKLASDFNLSSSGSETE